MKNKFYILIVPILLLMVFCLSGCTNISSERELTKYANKNYGKAKCINFQKDNESSTAFFLDETYGFTYTVSSYIDTINIDGSSFGSYETKKDTYTESFIAYIKDIIQSDLSNLQSKHNCTLKWNPYYSSEAKDDVLIFVKLKDKNSCKDITTSIGKLVENIDITQHFNKATIYGEYNNEFVGKYSLSSQIYLDSNDSNINWAMENAYTIMKTYKNISINSVEELSYINSEEMDVTNIPGINNETLSYRITDTNESLKHTMVYFYKFKNNTWIIADCLVAPYGHLYVYKLDS